MIKVKDICNHQGADGYGCKGWEVEADPGMPSEEVLNWCLGVLDGKTLKEKRPSIDEWLSGPKQNCSGYYKFNKVESCENRYQFCLVNPIKSEQEK